MKDIRIALVISRSSVGKTTENLDRMEKWIADARRQDAQLICFPELNITGYTSRKEIREVAESIPGKSTSRVIDMAGNSGLTILAGMAEKRKGAGIFASHILFTPDGNVDIYRKLHIAPPEKKIFSAGNAVPVFSACGITFGIQLCYDAHFPELTTHMAEKGAEVVFIPHASPRGTPGEKQASWMRHLPARAYDNSLFVAACNQTGTNNAGLNFPGLALVIGPSGQLLNEKLCSGEGMLIVDLEKDVFAGVRKNRMHYFLPNRRKDLFKT
jgi:predicted amidohydrolase